MLLVREALLYILEEQVVEQLVHLSVRRQMVAVHREQLWVMTAARKAINEQL